MQEEAGEDQLSLRLSIGRGGTKKRKRLDEGSNEKYMAVLLQARERMMRHGSSSSIKHSGNVDEKGVQLIRLLLICATAVDRTELCSAAEPMRQLYRRASVCGSPIERVAAYFADGLMVKLMRPNEFGALTAEEEFSAFMALYRATPYCQFAHFTANQAIIEAFEEDEQWNGGCLHVIDLDVSYGLQWPSLIQSLADKAKMNRSTINLRITGFGGDESELRDTEARLSSFAAGCRSIVFEFDGKLRGEKISITKNATLAVNLVFYLHTLKSHSEICAALAQICALGPSVVTLVEKEGTKGNHSGGFVPRFIETLHYFAAMFDSMDDCLPSGCRDRMRIEKSLFGKDIRNAVAGEEGGWRYERLEAWKALMEKNGFEAVRMSSRSVSQAKLLLKIKNHCSAMDDRGNGAGFRIAERDQGKALSLGWQHKHLITATAWRPAS